MRSDGSALTNRLTMFLISSQSEQAEERLRLIGLNGKLTAWIKVGQQRSGKFLEKPTGPPPAPVSGPHPQAPSSCAPSRSEGLMPGHGWSRHERASSK